MIRGVSMGEAATSIVMNTAEGNGWFAQLDHSHFLEIANKATAEVAARLEISAIRGGVSLDKADKLVSVWKRKKDEEHME